MEKIKLWLYDNSYKKAEKHPDKTGTGEVPKEALSKIVMQARESKDGESIKLRSAGWERTSKNGNPYLFVTMELDDGSRGNGKPERARVPKEDDLPW